EVIVRGARRILGDADVGVLEGLLDDELDWKWIVEAAERHGTAALVRAVLAERFADRVPPWVLIQLEAATHVQALRNEVLAQSLGQLASAFHDQGIRVLAFKGPVLAMSVYHDLRLRAF